MKHRSSPLLLAVVGVVLVSSLASCGSDGPDAYTAPPATDAPAGDESTGTDAPTEVGSGSVESGATGGEPAEPNGEIVDVRALDNTFIAETVEVAAGTEVRWENRGRNDHDVVPVDEGQDWGVEIEDFTPGDAYSHVFTEPGEYPYYCTIHGTAEVGMIGTIIVN